MSSTELSVADLCNLHLERQQRRIETGDVSRRHFNDNLRSCRRLVEHFGKFNRAASQIIEMQSVVASPDTTNNAP